MVPGEHNLRAAPNRAEPSRDPGGDYQSWLARYPYLVYIFRGDGKLTIMHGSRYPALPRIDGTDPYGYLVGNMDRLGDSGWRAISSRTETSIHLSVTHLTPGPVTPPSFDT